MQYEFVDTVQPEEPEEREQILPAEAMQFNGEYLEDAIDGYRTLYVRGRESMLAEINAYETGVRDGTGITSKRFPARELVIGYLLKADTNEAFREAYNTLNGILNTQDAQIIFHDEEDKYFTGTPEGLDEIETGRNFVQGEIIIYCADPFKYSVEEITTEEKSTYSTINYKGTYKAYPTMIANFTSDCGYVAWRFLNTGFKNGYARIELGNSSETEGENYSGTETLINTNFRDTSKTLSELLSGWDENYHSIWKVPGGSSYGLSGSTSLDTIGNGNGIQYLTAWDFMESPGGWTGSSISRSIPADSNGDVGATNWKASWNQILSNGDGGSSGDNKGGIQVLVTDSNDNLIAGVSMYKGSGDNSTTGNIVLYTANSTSTKTGIDYSRNNSRFGYMGNCYMTKDGNTVTWSLAGLTYSLTDSGITNAVATRVTVVFLQLSSYSHVIMGVYNIALTKSNITEWRDVSNSFSAGDTVEADCKSGTVLLNNAENASYGKIENDWESFCLYPGSQTVWFNYSSWAQNAPTTVIKYREVFI